MKSSGSSASGFQV
jgi:hypothetical protein